ncbi:MAG: helix-turn-helix domain-containing protein, partial [Eubacteriales bacterium]|nr:helix-turn-helix domain-containing protein [Eubacteriales bacterium]
APVWCIIISCFVDLKGPFYGASSNYLTFEFHGLRENKSRKTTLEERLAIVEHCTANNHNYALTAKEYHCSYGQVYSWVKKYETKGVEGLYDRRGRSKPTEELTELEKLKAENRLLKAQAKQQQMEIDFLKKLDAVERR